MTKANLDQHRIAHLVVAIWMPAATDARPVSCLSALACGKHRPSGIMQGR
jgi:hypothetical protein